MNVDSLISLSGVMSLQLVDGRLLAVPQSLLSLSLLAIRLTIVVVDATQLSKPPPTRLFRVVVIPLFRVVLQLLGMVLSAV